MKTISIYGGHDANLTFADSVSGKYHVIELERITKERFYKLQTQPVEDIISMLKYCQQIAEKFWGFKNDYDCLRLQTVSESSHNFFFNLLNKFRNYSDVNVLLNTSFNIKGNPILSTIEDALFVLDNTELDCLIIEDKIIEK
jgi:hypothetical protein